MVGENSGQIDRVARMHISEGVITGISDFKVVPVSFETGEMAATRIYFNHRVTINRLRGIVTKSIAAVDNGTIQGANSTGDSTGGLITCTASDGQNTEYSVSPSTNNIVEKDAYYSLTYTKATAGGKVLVTIEYTRIE